MKTCIKYLFLALYAFGFFILLNMGLASWARERSAAAGFHRGKEGEGVIALLQMLVSPVTILTACFLASLLDYVIAKVIGGEK